MLTYRRRSALGFCSSLAIATALAAAPQAAQAQSFQGSSTVVAGSATVTTGSSTTTVDVASPQAVINWTPFDTATSPGTPINFQPAGTTATFQGTSDFAVLNRILPNDPSRPIAFNGTVISQLQGNAAATPGGTVYFYSPGGILVGSTAVFNVGNLGLTALDPALDGNGNWYNGNQVQFQPGSPSAMVNIQPGAQLTATKANSYIAMVAPSVQNNGGTISVNGSAALVAAEAATITFSPDGLFNIQVTVGTSAESVAGNTALANSGSITGPAGTAGTDNHRIYLVAVPKNQMIANVIVAPGSTLGFNVASAADVVGNAVVLSAGYDIAAGAIAGPSAAGSGGGRIQINNAAFTSATTASATDYVTAQAASGSLSFASDANLYGVNSAQIDVTGSGGQLTVGRDLTLSANRNLPLAGATSDAGSAALTVHNAGQASVGGNLLVTANAFTDSTGDGKVTGGSAQVALYQNGSLAVTGNAILRAQGLSDGLTVPRAAVGGTAFWSADNGSTVNVGGVTRLRAEGVSGLGANATGGASTLTINGGAVFTTNELNVSADAELAGGPTGAPGIATGGQAIISVNGTSSRLTVNAGNSTGNANIGERELLSAEAFGGDSNGSGAAGSAQGGTARFLVSNGAVANLPVNPGAPGNIRMFARAYGGNTFVTGGTGGTATGGTVELIVNGGTLNAGNTLLPSSYAQGGGVDASVTGAANGGNAVGGIRNVTIVNGALNGSFSGGGPGAVGGNGTLLGTGGNGTGGTANFFMDNGTLIATTDAYGISRVTSFSQNFGGTGAIGGSATGGVSNVNIQNNSVITANPDANGIGGIVSFSATNTTPDLLDAGAIASGDAAGGSVNVTVLNSQINAAEFLVEANARSGAILSSGPVGANAHTGNATGGTATLTLNGATINAGSMFVNAHADAGDADTPGTVNAGTGTGGAARLFASTGTSTITADTLEVNAYGAGGTVFSGPGNGGNALGGRALLQANNSGQLTVNGAAFVFASAYGHSAQVQGRGGDGKSGFAEASAVGGGKLVINGDLEVAGFAESGDGTTAGFASAQVQSSSLGGLPNAIVYAANGSVVVTGATSLSADSYGGVGFAGAKGGNAQGGLAVVNSDNSTAGASSISLQDLLISASAYGGDGGTGVSGGVGGAGGDATGGEVDAFAGAGNGSLTVAGQTTLYATALGGSGGDGGSGTNGGAGGVGGTGTGGLAIFGTLSRADTGAVNSGSAVFGDVLAFADGEGGVGGAGGVGSSSTGNGGAGGPANGGTSLLLVRGSHVTVTGQANLIADAVGGDGGTGAVQGAGGAATVGGNGGVGVSVISRFQQPTQRGFLDAQDIFGTAQAFGGAGLVTGAATAADSPLLLEVSGGNLSAAVLSLFAGGDPVAAAAPSIVSIANGTVNIADELAVSTPGALSVSLDNSTVNVANLRLAAGNFVLPATRPTTFGTFNVSGTLDLESLQDFLVYANFKLATGATFDSDGAILTGDITANGVVNLSAAKTITTGSVTAPSVILVGNQGVTTSALTANSSIIVASGGPVSVGALSAGGTTPGAGKIAIGSNAGPVTAGAIQSTGDLGIQTSGSITTGNLIGRDVLLLAGGSINTGSVLAASGTQATGAIYFGNFNMATSSVSVFQPFRGQSGLLPIFQATPVAIGGSATFGGPIQGGSLKGAAQGALSAQGINAASLIDLTAGGLASINGAWRSPDITLVSGDIAISSNGSLDALSATGSIELASTNTAGVTVGDGAGNTGYVLDNAEFGRIKAGDVSIVGLDTQQATDMTIGDLTITGSQLYGDGGSVLFATGNRQTQTPGGILRIAGAVNATGFAAGNEIDLAAGTVELEAVKGSLRAADAAGALGGLIYIEADHIHVASDAVLTKLRADPLYAGHIADLNTPLAVARPEGVLSAAAFEFYPGQTLYVQNTGTATVPAGFLVNADSVEITPPDQPPTGGIEVVVNGQFQSGQNRLTGRAAYDQALSGTAGDSSAFAGFSTTSQLNGCLFTAGTCGSSGGEPVAPVASEIIVVTSAALDDSPRAPTADDSDEGTDGSSEDRDDDDDSDTGSAPIAPPAPLISTRPLNPNADIEQPVAGGGNPAFLGTAITEETPQGEKK